MVSYISQELGSQQGKAFYNHFERALSKLGYAARLSGNNFRPPPTHPTNNCLIVQKLTCGGLLVLGRIVPLYECGEIPKRGCYALGDPVKHNRRMAWPSLGGATPLKPGGGYVGDGTP